MKYLFFLFGLIIICCCSTAQKVYTKNGSVSFYSKASLEDISADNGQMMRVLDMKTGQLQFSVLIKAFHFKKNLMEVHFNENYMESDKYPKALFKGTVSNISSLDLTKDGSYPVTVSGDMTIHNITKNIQASGTLTVKAGTISSSAVFKIKPADYNISIPKIVKDNIAETIDVTVSCLYDKKM